MKTASLTLLTTRSGAPSPLRSPYAAPLEKLGVSSPHAFASFENDQSPWFRNAKSASFVDVMAFTSFMKSTLPAPADRASSIVLAFPRNAM